MSRIGKKITSVIPNERKKYMEREEGETKYSYYKSSSPNVGMVEVKTRELEDGSTRTEVTFSNKIGLRSDVFVDNNGDGNIDSAKVYLEEETATFPSIRRHYEKILSESDLNHDGKVDRRELTEKRYKETSGAPRLTPSFWRSVRLVDNDFSGRFDEKVSAALNVHHVESVELGIRALLTFDDWQAPE